jgi:hypothetical protein
MVAQVPQASRLGPVYGLLRGTRPLPNAARRSSATTENPDSRSLRQAQTAGEATAEVRWELSFSPPRPTSVNVGLSGMVVSVLGVALVSGCTSATPAPTQVTITEPAATQVTVTYSVGKPERSARAVTAACPAKARCRVESIPHVSPHLWMLVVRRSLRCGPAGGAYPNPVAACRALADLNRLRQHTAGGVCSCPAVFGVKARAHGRVNGHPATIPLDFCTYCGLGGHAVGDLHVLTPGAT